MKIAVFHELHAGGARSSVNELGKYLKKRHEIDLYIVDEKLNEKERIFFNTVNFYQFIPKKWTGGDWKARLYKDSIELYKLSRLHKKISSDILKKQYDILFVNASKYIESPFLLKFPNTKKIFYLHDPHYRILYENALIKKERVDVFRQLYEKLNRTIRKVIDRQNLNGADIFLANSKFTQKMFKKTYKKESIVAYLGVDTIFFSPINTKKEWDILYVGSREPVDDYALLEDAGKYMKKKPNIKTVFYEDEWISKEKIRELYRRSKIVLALGVNEPFGLIPLEAMACGTPVIAIDEGGYKETVINGQTGYLVPRDPKILSEKIEFLLSHEKHRLTMADNSRNNIVKHWTWEKSINNLEKILQSVS